MASFSMRISVVIPVLEDRFELQRTVKGLGEADELVVVDASRCDPVQRSDLPPGARLIRAARANRARQQNLGAGTAGGEILLLLHADTRLGEGAFRNVRMALEDPAVVGGGFERFFDSPSRFLHWSCRGGGLRSRNWAWFLGDQAIFVRRRDFVEVGGFQDLTAFEDYDLCRRLKKRGRLRCLGPPVLSSARRFAGGAVRRGALDFLLTMLYLAAGPEPFRMRQNSEIKAGPDPLIPC